MQAANYVASTALGIEPDLFDGNVKTITIPHSAAARNEEDLRISFMLNVPYSIVTAVWGHFLSDLHWIIQHTCDLSVQEGRTLTE